MSSTSTEDSNSLFKAEIEYWDKELSLNGAYPDAIRHRSIPDLMYKEFPFYIMPHFVELTNKNTYVPHVLDVGSGPLSMLNYGYHNRFINLTCADPLADTYKQLLIKHGLQSDVKMVACRGEALTDTFGGNSFDMVWMHNAIDHSQNPPKVFEELVSVLRPGGFLVVQGWTREGTAEGWLGLHQHDVFLLTNDKLMCESKDQNTGKTTITCLNQGLPINVVSSSEPSLEPRTWLRIIFKKNTD